MTETTNTRLAAARRRTIVTATTLLIALAAACYEPPTLPHTGPRLAVADTGTADGASLLPLTAIVDTAATPAAKRAVTLTTTAGVFTASGTASATINPDLGGRAIALLRAPAEATTAIVTATVNGETVSHTIEFRRAMPDRVDIVPDDATLRVGSTPGLGVTVYLRRTIGTPSAGLAVTLSSATPDDPSQVGYFNPAALWSDATGVLHARFVVADTTRRGAVQLRASVAEAQISGAATIQLLAP